MKNNILRLLAYNQLRKYISYIYGFIYNITKTQVSEYI